MALFVHKYKHISMRYYFLKFYRIIYKHMASVIDYIQHIIVRLS